jgi:hypothetical protein
LGDPYSAFYTCYDDYDADLLVFDNDLEIYDFLNILQSGISFLSIFTIASEGI